MLAYKTAPTSGPQLSPQQELSFDDVDHIRNAMAQGQTIDQPTLKQIISNSPMNTGSADNYHGVQMAGVPFNYGDDRSIATVPNAANPYPVNNSSTGNESENNKPEEVYPPFVNEKGEKMFRGYINTNHSASDQDSYAPPLGLPRTPNPTLDSIMSQFPLYGKSANPKADDLFSKNGKFDLGNIISDLGNGGYGVSFGAMGEAGLGAGAAGSISRTLAFFPHTGQWALIPSDGGFAGVGNGNHNAYGIYGSGGLSIFHTNAQNPSQLLGPFDTKEGGIGFKEGLGVQYSKDPHTNIQADAVTLPVVTPGFSAGIGYGHYQTNTPCYVDILKNPLNCTK